MNALWTNHETTEQATTVSEATKAGHFRIKANDILLRHFGLLGSSKKNEFKRKAGFLKCYR